MLELGERELIPEERRALEEHLERCPECASFRTFWQGLRTELREDAGPAALSSELSERVRLRCRAELDSRPWGRGGKGFRTHPAAVPWPIYSALLVLLGLTLLFLIPGLGQLRQTQKLTLGAAFGLLIILQNALMLFFTPLLLRGAVCLPPF
jgi:anti-sigma factor RsiW